MIIVRIFLKKRGIGPEKQIAQIKIANNLTGNDRYGNYNYILFGRRNVLMQSGMINGFKRKSKHVFDLLKFVLTDARK